ncbi:hypothetical protein ARMGADRAFT_323326 [Armillaria gallica]|uniref:Uncharacterized protein n=1 Tax=Armillaria gallica TaxID=47427 RepID=A0A2H3D3W4_ARMGA|nr:hypothetical protein ARMGADRAFT_323326 [Armillaria gallica]
MTWLPSWTPSLLSRLSNARNYGTLLPASLKRDLVLFSRSVVRSFRAGSVPAGCISTVNISGAPTEAKALYCQQMISMTRSLNLSLTHVPFVGMTLAVSVVSVSCVDEKNQHRHQDLENLQTEYIVRSGNQCSFPMDRTMGRKLPELRVLWRLWEALLVFASSKSTYSERCRPIHRGCPNVSIISLISTHGQVMKST